MQVKMDKEVVEKGEDLDSLADDDEVNEASSGQFQSPYAYLYKTPNIASQNDRRKAILIAVKKRRNASMDEKRGISEIFDDVELTVQEEEGEPMDTSKPLKKSKQKRRHAKKLMLSEYLKETPCDIETNWLLKLCPVGSRNLVIASNKTTRAFDKRGYVQNSFETLLPGGGANCTASKFTILDCIYNKATESYYILDILAWNSYSLVNCSAEFRFFFLKCKMDENPEVSEVSRHNKHAFYESAAHPAQIQTIENLFSAPIDGDNPVLLDGVLFYHSEVDYRAGSTPLVGWLKPYMIPEIFGIPIHPDYLIDRPKNYTSLKDHLRRCRKQTEVVDMCV